MIGSIRTLKRTYLVLILLNISKIGWAQRCQMKSNCFLPDCFCNTETFPLLTKAETPQFVYFGFDDAVNAIVKGHFDYLFPENATNPNGCSIQMTLYVSHANTNYRLVEEYYKRGHEIAVHSITHTNIKSPAQLIYEAGTERKMLSNYSNIPEGEIVGWRSPNLFPTRAQTETLKSLNFKYDATYTRLKTTLDRGPTPWPFTLDYGWPYNSCQTPPCPSKRVPGFWIMPVLSVVDYKSLWPCVYIDGCINDPKNEEDSFKFLLQNFQSFYGKSRAPFGIHMHARWFVNQPFHLSGMQRFINHILSLPDVYIVRAKDVISWIQNPKNVEQMKNSECSESLQKSAEPITTMPATTTTTPTTTTTTTTAPATTTTTPTTPTTMPTTTTTTPTTTISPPTTPTTTPTTPTTTPTTTKTTPTITTTPTTTTTTPITTTTPPITTTTTPTIRITTPPTTTTVPTSKAKAVPTALPTTHATSSSKDHDSASPLLTKVEKQSQGATDATLAITTGAKENFICVQEVNCFRPNCICESTEIPGNLNATDVPQMVYITYDGKFDAVAYRLYNTMFDFSPVNPNGCPVKATVFVNYIHSRYYLVKRMSRKGFEIAIHGIHRNSNDSGKYVDSDIQTQILKLMILGKIERSKIKGWRISDLGLMGDEQFDMLARRSIEYDASLILNNSLSTWPFTLDFGTSNNCETPNCPKKSHPGIWEVAFTPSADNCLYIDNCDANDISQSSLQDEFNVRYNGTRAPMGIHMTGAWFHRNFRRALAKLTEFMKTVSKYKDVYLVTVGQVISWIKNPTPLDKLASFEPWQCDQPMMDMDDEF